MYRRKGYLQLIPPTFLFVHELLFITIPYSAEWPKFCQFLYPIGI